MPWVSLRVAKRVNARSVMTSTFGPEMIVVKRRADDDRLGVGD